MVSGGDVTTLVIAALLLGALVLPMLLALVARLVGDRRPRLTLLLGGLLGVTAIGSVAALQRVPIDRAALGPLAIFVPARAPLLEEQSFAWQRAPRAASLAPTPPSLALGMASAEAVVLPTLAPAATTIVPTPPPPTATPSSTSLPTATPEPTSTATAVPPATSTPTATEKPTPRPEPTATEKPTPRPEPTATKRPQPTATPRAAAQRTYTVRPGDTLRSIAEDFGVTVEALLRVNGLSRSEGDNLRPDQVLVIPSGSTAPAPTRPRQQRQTYTVQAGDSLRSIAERFGVTVQALLDANGLSPQEGDQIRPGQKLIIPAR